MTMTNRRAAVRRPCGCWPLTAASREEIVRDYTQAANKGKQIKILADLNCVSPGEIRAVLAATGVPGIRAPERIRRQKAEAAAERPQPETASALSFWEHTEAILAALPDELPPEAESIVQNLLQTLFADYIGRRLEGRARHGS